MKNVRNEESKTHLRQQALGMIVAYSKTKRAKLFEGDPNEAATAKRRAKNKVAGKSRRINRRK